MLQQWRPRKINLDENDPQVFEKSLVMQLQLLDYQDKSRLCRDRKQYRNRFFQAEDGIRDSVASRGLGDVYKRQKLKK